VEIQRWHKSVGFSVKDFRELKVWQKAHQLTLAVYQLTASFPRGRIVWIEQSTTTGGLFDRG
jgi:hypothetical protein